MRLNEAFFLHDVKKIKSIFFDLDGTLVLENSKVTKNMKTKLQLLKDKGYEIFLITGRDNHSLKTFLEKEGMDEIFSEPIICQDGNLFLFKNGERSFQKSIDSDFIKKTLIEKNYFDDFILLTENEFFFSSKHSKFRYLLLHSSNATSRKVEKNNLKDIMQKNILQIYIFFTHNESAIKKEAEKISKNNRDYIFDYNARYGFVKVYPAIDKSLGINYLYEVLNMKLDKIMAIGNGDNDLEMIKKAYIGVSVQGSTKNLKDNADIILQENLEDFLMKLII